MYRFTTALSHSFYDEDENLLFIRLKSEPEPTLSLTKVNFEQTHYHVGKAVVKVIIDARKLAFAHIPKEVLDYMGKNEYNQYQESVAIVINGLGQKMLINFYLSVVKPVNKTKMFTSTEEALKWQKIVDTEFIGNLIKDTP
jgi:hypothetical protein